MVTTSPAFHTNSTSAPFYANSTSAPFNATNATLDTSANSTVAALLASGAAHIVSRFTNWGHVQEVCRLREQ